MSGVCIRTMCVKVWRRRRLPEIRRGGSAGWTGSGGETHETPEERMWCENKHRERERKQGRKQEEKADAEEDD